MIEFARKNPVSYGTTAVGGSTHLAMEEIARITGSRWSHSVKGGGRLRESVGNSADGRLPPHR